MGTIARREPSIPAIDAAMVLRAQGADPARVRERRPRLAALAERALREGAPLLRPVLVERRLEVVAGNHARVRLSDGAPLRVPAVASKLAGAVQALVIVTTVGDDIARAARDAARSDAAFALALEAVGIAAVQELVDSRLRALDGEVGDRGWRRGVPLAPGMAGWPLAGGQRVLFELVAPVPAVRLLESGMMWPRHALSLLIGVGPDIDGGLACDTCAAFPRCRHRPAAC